MVLIFCHVLVRPVAGRGAARGRCTHKVDADGGDVALCVCVVGESKQQARLSDTRVTDEEELEEVVVSGGDLSAGMAIGGGGGGRGQLHGGSAGCMQAGNSVASWLALRTGVDLAWRAPQVVAVGAARRRTYYSGFILAGVLVVRAEKDGVSGISAGGEGRRESWGIVGRWQAVSSTKV